MKKKAPLYFKILLAGVGCYALQDLSTLVTALVGDPTNMITASSIAVIGCFTFFSIANHGEVDRFVDDGTNKKAKVIAAIAPILLIAYFTFFVASYSQYTSLARTLISFLVIVPASMAIYFAFKHLLLPLDDMGFLKATRGTNLTMILFTIIQFGYTPIYYFGTQDMLVYYYLPMSGSLALFTIACVRGVDIWKSSI